MNQKYFLTTLSILLALVLKPFDFLLQSLDLNFMYLSVYLSCLYTKLADSANTPPKMK